MLPTIRTYALSFVKFIINNCQPTIAIIYLGIHDGYCTLCYIHQTGYIYPPYPSALGVWLRI